MRRVLSGVLLAGALSCQHELYSVSAQANGGIPFLPIEAVDSVASTYAQDWFEVVVTAELALPGGKAGDPERGRFTQHLVLYTEQEKAALEVLARFNAQTSAAGALEAAREAMTAAAGFSTAQPPARDPAAASWRDGLTLLSVSRGRSQAPAGAPMYLNTLVPFGGTSTGSLQLSSNGTLSQVQSSIDDKAAASLASAVGGVLTSAITGVTGLLAPAAAPKAAAPSSGAPSPRVLTARVAITPLRRLYHLTVESSPSLGERGCATALGLAPAPFAGSSGAGSGTAGQPAVCRGTFSTEVARGAETGGPPSNNPGAKDGGAS